MASSTNEASLNKVRLSSTSKDSSITIQSGSWEDPFTSEYVHTPHYKIPAGGARHYKRKPTAITRNVQPLQIAFRNLTYKIILGKKAQKDAPNEKVILNDLNGIFCAARLTAILGSSGSGKTTLLNALSGNLLKGQLTGEILVNGDDYSGKISNISGNVTQDDIFLPTMTVREAIKMSVLLRLPKSIEWEERLNRVDDVIELLNLQNCQHTKIGTPEKKGISGGERKRTSIAMELVANPPILFLDEPTSGLDAFTAFVVVRKLSWLCKRGRTVILTIHQPSSEIFSLFDDLLVLAEGQIVYYGPAADMVKYFNQLGYAFPAFSNPSDYLFMEILRPDKFERMEELMQEVNFSMISNFTEKDQNEQDAKIISDQRTRRNIKQLVQAWKESPEYERWIVQVRNPAREGVYVETVRKRAPFLTQFKYLTGRAARNLTRNPALSIARVVKTLFIGLLVGLTFLNSNQYSIAGQIQNKSGALFYLAVNVFYGAIFMVLTVFYKEKYVFFHEYRAGYYTTTAYFFSKFLVELPTNFFPPYIIVLIAYYMVGFNPPFSDYLMIATLIALCSINGMAFGMLMASITDDIQISLVTTLSLAVPLTLLSGLFANNGALPVYINWLKYISPIYYSFIGEMQVEFSRSFPNCDPSQGNCDGKIALNLYGLNNALPPGISVVFLVTIWIFLVLASYLCLATITRIKYGRV